MSIKPAIQTCLQVATFGGGKAEDEYSKKVSDWTSVLNVWTFHVTIEN